LDLDKTVTVVAEEPLASTLTVLNLSVNKDPVTTPQDSSIKVLQTQLLVQASYSVTVFSLL
jgi:hypothetical protein